MTLAEEILDLVVTNCDLDSHLVQAELDDLLGQIEETIQAHGRPGAHKTNNPHYREINKAVLQLDHLLHKYFEDK